jgi:biotin-(acetyl-CoA carboxylase) ligase
LEIESDRPIDRTGVAIALLQALDRWLGVNPDKRRSALREAWSMRCEPMGSRVRVRHRGAVHVGTLVDIDPHSALIVELESGGRRAFEAANSTILEHDGATST